MILLKELEPQTHYSYCGEFFFFKEDPTGADGGWIESGVGRRCGGILPFPSLLISALYVYDILLIK